jgi:transcriptional regulator with PAS, ATPase and Fis domain
MDVRSNRPLLLLLFLGVIGIIGTGSFAYRLLTGPTAPADWRFLAERILYASFCAGGLFLLAGGSVIVRSVRIDKKLDHLIEQSRYRQLNEETDFRGFGVIGSRLRKLFHGLLSLNEKLSRKIASQGSLLDMVISNSAAKMLVTDSDGSIRYISKGLLESLKKETRELKGKEVSTIWKELVFPEIRSLMEEKFQPYSLETEEYPLSAYPIISKDNLVAYVLFNAEKRPFFYTPKNSGEEKKKKRSFQEEFSRIVRRGHPNGREKIQ